MKIDPQSDTPIFQQIVANIEREILTGHLKQGDFIPSVRDLALSLMLNPNTVAKAYQHLQTLNLVELERGKGLRVRGRKEQAMEQKRQDLLHAKTLDLRDYAISLGFTTKDIIKILES